MNSSGDEQTPEHLYPQPSGEWHRSNAASLAEQRQADADAADELWKRELHAITEKARLRFESLACKGEDANVGDCSDENAATCSDRRGLSCPKFRAEEAERERRELRARQRKYLESVNVSPRTLRAVFDAEPLETEAVKAVRAALATSPKPSIIVLQGGVGCGKSCAAALWASENNAKWITAKTLARMGYDDELAVLGKCSALVLDDLGTEYADAKGFFVSNLDGLIDDRYARELPTVITTNVEPEEFKSRYGERIADRIREAGKFIKVKGESLRRRAG